MRIDPEHLPGVTKEPAKAGGSSQSARISGPEGPASARPTPPEPGDGVVLSQKAEEFRKAGRRLESLPESGQADRVASLKARLAAGQYSVDGRQIAGAMLQDEPTAALLGLSAPR